MSDHRKWPEPPVAFWTAWATICFIVVVVGVATDHTGVLLGASTGFLLSIILLFAELCRLRRSRS